MTNVAIAAQALDKWFGESEARTRALMQVSFETGFSEMLFIVGPSGSGKTALLNAVSGILRSDGGRTMVDGVDIWSLGADALTDFRLGRIGFVSQDYHLFPRLTTIENVAVPLILRHVAQGITLDQTMHYLGVVGLKNRAQLPPAKLSGGEQQRVAIAHAIVTQPDILILDEPTASLDGDTNRSIMQFVKTEILNAHRCIVIVTHDARILDLTSRILDMEDGKLNRIERGAIRWRSDSCLRSL